MLQSWRWYGDFDKISLSDVVQTGAKSVVTALHEIPYGEVWPTSAIANKVEQIQAAGLGWSVAESLPIHEDIKKGQGELAPLFANYRQSMANLASNGVHTICYNFMPLLDWTRTDLATPAEEGGTCLRFSNPKMAAFELFMLKRPAAENDYSEEVIRQASAWLQQSDEQARESLLTSIMAGLPGEFQRYDVEGLRAALKEYEGIDRTALRANYLRFLEEVIPTAEELGMRMCVHPDDPPRDILGLPRIVSDETDIDWILSAVEHQSNGLTLCSGSLGANPNNDVPAIARRFADRIHFAHLRNVSKDPDGSFQEAAHLEGDTDMVALVKVLVGEEKCRREIGRPDHNLPFRPDHGHELLGDGQMDTHPGYPLIGRLRGLAELRGVLAAVSHIGA